MSTERSDILDRMDQERDDYGTLRQAVETYRNAVGSLLSDAEAEIKRLRQANTALRTTCERLLEFARDHQGEEPADHTWKSRRIREDIDAAERALIEDRGP